MAVIVAVVVMVLQTFAVTAHHYSETKSNKKYY